MLLSLDWRRGYLVLLLNVVVCRLLKKHQPRAERLSKAYKTSLCACQLSLSHDRCRPSETCWMSVSPDVRGPCFKEHQQNKRGDDGWTSWGTHNAPLHPLAVILPVFSNSGCPTLSDTRLRVFSPFFPRSCEQQKIGPATTALFKYWLEMSSYSNTAPIPLKPQMLLNLRVQISYRTRVYVFVRNIDREQRPSGGWPKRMSIVLLTKKDCVFNLHKPEQQNPGAIGGDDRLETTVATGHKGSEDGKRDLSPLFTSQHSVSFVTATLLLVEVNDIPVTCLMAVHCGY